MRPWQAHSRCPSVYQKRQVMAVGSHISPVDVGGATGLHRSLEKAGSQLVRHLMSMTPYCRKEGFGLGCVHQGETGKLVDGAAHISSAEKVDPWA